MYDLKPEGMIAYLRYNGYHFNKKMSQWAVSLMYKQGKQGKEEPIEYWDKEKVKSLLIGQGVNLSGEVDYDAVYVANMARADFFKSSIEDEEHLALFIRDMVEDPDQKDGFIFHRFYADCCLNGIPIPWEDLI